MTSARILAGIDAAALALRDQPAAGRPSGLSAIEVDSAHAGALAELAVGGFLRVVLRDWVVSEELVTDGPSIWHLPREVAALLNDLIKAGDTL